LVKGELVGVVGDTFQLPAGEYVVWFFGSYGYYFSLTLKLSQAGINVLKQSVDRGIDCVEGHLDRHKVQKWPAPEVRKFGAPRLSVWEIVITDPSYVEPPGQDSMCITEPSMMQLRQLGSVTLTITSKPPGASVYIHGKPEGTTDTRLVVPFYQGNDTIRVLMRKPGYVNCVGEIKAVARSEGALNCALVALPKSP
jgi:hypothetical protein